MPRCALPLLSPSLSCSYVLSSLCRARCLRGGDGVQPVPCLHPAICIKQVAIYRLLGIMRLYRKRFCPIPRNYYRERKRGGRKREYSRASPRRRYRMRRNGAGITRSRRWKIICPGPCVLARREARVPAKERDGKRDEKRHCEVYRCELSALRVTFRD